MAASITSLPVELIELITSDFDLATLRKLRLVCQNVRHKIDAGRHFTHFCSWKRVQFTEASLRQFEQEIKELPIASRLQHLAVVGVLCITLGLERIVRQRSIARHDRWKRAQGRRRATPEELADVKAQLAHFRYRNKEQAAEAASGADCQALEILFSTIAQRCRLKGLKSLSLDLVVFRDKTRVLSPCEGAPHQAIWQQAKHTFSVATQAWEKSGISIEHFDAFGHLEACGIEVTSLPLYCSQLGSLAGIKALTLNLGNQIIPLGPHEWALMDDPDENPRKKKNMKAAGESESSRNEPWQPDVDELTKLATFLQQHPHLEHLDLRWYTLFNGRDSPMLGMLVLSNIAKQAALQNLRKLCLRHFCVQVQDLESIIKGSPLLQSLALREIQLVPCDGRSWSFIFRTLSAPESHVNYVYLDNIFELRSRYATYVVCYKVSTGPEWGPRYAWRPGFCVGEELDRKEPAAEGMNAFTLATREEVSAGISYYLGREISVSRSHQELNWWHETNKRYGHSI